MHKQRSPPIDLRTKYITSVSCLLLSLPLHFPDSCFSTVIFSPFLSVASLQLLSHLLTPASWGCLTAFQQGHPRSLKHHHPSWQPPGVHPCWGAGARSLLQQAEPYNNVCQQPRLEITRFIVVAEEMVIQSS